MALKMSSAQDECECWFTAARFLGQLCGEEGGWR
jgi:hypothetical protein